MSPLAAILIVAGTTGLVAYLALRRRPAARVTTVTHTIQHSGAHHDASEK